MDNREEKLHARRRAKGRAREQHYWKRARRGVSEYPHRRRRTIHSAVDCAPCVGVRFPPSPEAEIQTENRMWQELEEGMDKLRTAFQEIVDPALYTPERHYSIETPGVGSNVLRGVRFTLRGLSTQRGSITLISILGAVYVGAKDYETLRKSLLVLADDIRRMRARVMEVPAWWDIDRDILQGQAQAALRRTEKPSHRCQQHKMVGSTQQSGPGVGTPDWYLLWYLLVT